MRVAVVFTLGLLAAAALLGCGRPDGAAGAGSAEEVARCGELARDHAVDGPLSADEEVAGWQQWRANAGVPSDIESTIAAGSAEASLNAEAFGWMTDEEFDAYTDRNRAANEVADQIQSSVEARRDFAFLAPDNATGRLLVGVTGDTDALQAELDETVGVRRVEVIAMPRTKAELGALRDKVRAHLDREGVASAGIGQADRHGRVTIALTEFDSEVVANIAQAFAGDLDGMCVHAPATSAWPAGSR